MADKTPKLEFEALRFTKDWTNPADFPTYEPNETQVRADQQLLFNEIKAWLNDTLTPAVKSAAETGGVTNVYINSKGHLIIVMATGEEYDVGIFNAAQSLFSMYGDVVSMTVDSLSTSRRIVRYLAGDKSDDNFVTVKDQYVRYMTGTTDGTAVQHKDPTGKLLYWTQDITDLPFNDQGYPAYEGAQVLITTEQTDWPVMVYKYTDSCKMEMAFSDIKEDGTNYYIPSIVLGVGDNNGNAKGYIYKLANALRIDYLQSNGNKVSLSLSDAGVKVIGAGDTTGLRNVITVDEKDFDYTATYGAVGDIVAVLGNTTDYEAQSARLEARLAGESVT